MLKYGNILYFIIIMSASCLALSGCVGSLPFPYRLSSQDVLSPSSVVTGARSISSGAYINFRQPAAIAARDGEIYFADIGLHRVFHYDLEQKNSFTYDAGIRADAESSIFVAADNSIYITNPKEGEVLHFSADGMQLPSLRSLGNMVRPIGVISDESSGTVAIADAALNQIIMFDSWGAIRSIIKLPMWRSISAIATGPDGIYVMDALERQITVLDRYDGALLYSFSIGLTEQPYFLAVNRNNLIFVGDKTRRLISLYQDRRLAMQVSSNGDGSGGFVSLDGMAVFGNQLYISDGFSARIQIFQINQLALGRSLQGQARFMEMNSKGDLIMTTPDRVNSGVYQ